MNVRHWRWMGIAAGFALLGCSANPQTAALETNPVSGSVEATTATPGSLATVTLASAASIPSTSTITSIYDVRVTWPTRFGSGYPLRQWYPSFAYYYPYMAVAFRSYPAWGHDFVHPRYGWQPAPGIGYINNHGVRYPAMSVRRTRETRPTVIDGIHNRSVGRSTWSAGSR